MPLTELALDGCVQLRNLELVRGLKTLQHLHIWGCKQIDDLAPLKGMELHTIALNPRFIKKGWEVLWNMKILETVDVGESRGIFPAAKFRELYEKGEFK